MAEAVTPRRQSRMSGPERATVLCAAFAAFVFQFEAYLVAVALPSMAVTFSLTTTEASFIPMVYLLGATLVFIPAGTLSERLGLRRLFVASIPVLASGTLLCGIAPSYTLLLWGRIIQGVGVGGMASLGYALIPAHVPRERSGSAYGVMGLMAGMGMLVGAPTGGILAEFLSWRWVFLSNLPGMVILAGVSALLLPPDRNASPAAAMPIPLAGLTLSGGALALGVLGLSLGTEFGWGSPTILLCLTTAFLAALAFLISERRATRPLISRALRVPEVLSGLLALFLVMLARGGTIFLIPFYLEARCGFTPTTASTVLLAHAFAFAAAGWFAGRLADRLGAPRLVAAGVLVSGAACLVLAGLVTLRFLPGALLCMLALGIGSGLFQSPNSKFTLGQVSPEHGAEAASLLTLALNTGTVAGVSVFDTVLSLGLPETGALPSHLSEGTAGWAGAATTGFTLSFVLAGTVFLLVALLVRRFYR